MSKRKPKRDDVVRAHQPTPDEIAKQDLADVVQRLQVVADALVGREVAYLDGTTLTYLSLYEELCELSSGGGGNGESYAATFERGQAPMWITGWALVYEIDTAVALWTDAGNTVDGIRQLTERHWTTDQLRQLTELTDNIVKWVGAAERLINPRTVQVRRPCPVCAARYTYTKDTHGDHVRTPALQLDAEGVRCLSCRASWGLDQAEFLQRLMESEELKEAANAA